DFFLRGNVACFRVCALHAPLGGGTIKGLATFSLTYSKSFASRSKSRYDSRRNYLLLLDLRFRCPMLRGIGRLACLAGAERAEHCRRKGGTPGVERNRQHPLESPGRRTGALLADPR